MGDKVTLTNRKMATTDETRRIEILERLLHSAERVLSEKLRLIDELESQIACMAEKLSETHDAEDGEPGALDDRHIYSCDVCGKTFVSYESQLIVVHTPKNEASSVKYLCQDCENDLLFAFRGDEKGGYVGDLAVLFEKARFAETGEKTASQDAL